MPELTNGPAARPILTAATLVAVPMIVALVLLAGPAPSFAVLTRDMADTAGVPPWLGFLSFIGILYWTAAAAIAVFSSSLALRSNGDARFLAILGLTLGLLALDDLFMVHELVAPSLGIPEPVSKAAYVLAVAAFALAYRSRFVGIDRLLALLAAAAFACSLAVDSVSQGGNTSSATEGSLKLVGITLLLVTTVHLSRAALERSRAPSTSR